ncbi:family 16 glycosylhydrolase [Mucilaginibacter sp. X4EP1]|uniref:family 16 glycosylhydrolase n=1 Tax=Mucilaginibacter sp. X4EP1 TaxID=2723092 RepID=UPI002168DEF3|nr:family 16 glycosylhydrolase [Mucilaginibacter sp. X4EP1]MCS3814299.1 beta-glucanase (GH16 family) [Mucilaginibacter sp. X4EP1]
MKTHLLKFLTGTGMVLLLLMAFSCKKDISPKNALTSSNTQTTAPRAVTYQLIWSDEFNGTSVDNTKWTMETGNPGVNNEKEYYQASNATVSNGNLVITAMNQSVGGWPYTSARMNTSGKFSCQYGRIEASMKLPLGQGLWPAFWMLGTNINTVGWPQCGEQDIMEHVNADNTIYGTIHWYDNGNTQYGGNTTTNPDAYHLYAVQWDTNSITWWVDNNLYATANIANNINNTGAFQNPFFIILNMAVAGDFPGQTVDLSKLPASMYVDYVRVYKGVTSSGPPIGQTITLKGFNNDYVSGEDGTTAMTCTRTVASTWEQFLVVDAGNGKVALQSMGKYVSSENGTMPITCNRTSFSTWEEFTWGVNADGTITLQGNNGDFISSEDGTQAMTCNRTVASGWESFKVNQ